MTSTPQQRTSTAAGAEDGFTLVELLVVVVIVGVLAAIAVPALWHDQQKGYDAAAKADLRSAADAEEDYYASHGSYADLNTVVAEDPVRLSKNDQLFTVYVDATKGFCLGATSTSGSTAGANQSALAAAGFPKVIWWYDSAAGGLQRAGANTNTPNVYGCPTVNGTTGAQQVGAMLGS